MDRIGEPESARKVFSKESYLFNWLLTINKHVAGKNRALLIENHRLQSRINQLEEANFIDDATGLHNKRYLQIRLREEFARARRHGLPLSCVFIDLDNFKSVNDRYGHVTGDRLLKEVASLLKNLCRGEDALVRFGGEEFVVLMADTDGDKAVILAERIREKIDNHLFCCDSTDVSLSASVGVSTFAGSDYENVCDPEALIAMADKAMYTVKHNGKNSIFYLPFRFETHSPLPSGVGGRHCQEVSV